MLISGSSCEKVCSCRLSTNSLVYIGIQRHMYNNISLNSQIMPDNVLDCKKSSTDESSFSELSEFHSPCQSLHQIEQFIFCGNFHILSVTYLSYLVGPFSHIKRNPRNYVTVLIIDFFCICSHNVFVHDQSFACIRVSLLYKDKTFLQISYLNSVTFQLLNV